MATRTAYGIEHGTEGIRAGGNHRVAQNDEPEPQPRSALYAAFLDLAAARDERNTALRDEMQALADQIAARPSADTLRLRQSAPVITRAPLPEGAYRMRTTCSLCGDASDRQVCARCDVGLRELGL